MICFHTGSDLLAWRITNDLATLTTIDSGSAVDNASSTNQVVRAGISGCENASAVILLWSQRASITNKDSTYMRCFDVDSSAASEGNVHELGEVSLLSKPVFDSHRDVNYAILAQSGFIPTQDATERACYVVNCRYAEARVGSDNIVPFVEARFANGLATNPLAMILSSGALGWTVPFVQVKPRVFEAFTGVLESAQADAIEGFSGVIGTRFTSDQKLRHTAVETGSLLYVAGGDLKFYDAPVFVEAGFPYFPYTQLTDFGAAASGSIPDDPFDVRLTYEHKTPSGIRHRSAASTAVTVTTGGPNLKVTMTATAPILRLTRRTDVVWGFYRSLANATATHHAALSVAESFTVMDQDLVGPGTLESTLSDAAIQVRQKLYQDGNVLANDAPPASDIIWSHDSALFGIDPEDPKRVWGTKQSEFGIPAEHNGVIQIRVDSSTGLTAGASSGGQIILFDEDSIYIVGGVGFTNTAGGGYQAPRKLPTSNGCINHLSLVQGGETGDLYYQSKNGICVLRRGAQAAQVISAPIQSALDDFPVVMDSVINPAENRIYWSISDDAATSAAGCVTWFDYRRGKWGTDSSAAWGSPGRLAVWDDRLVVLPHSTSSESNKIHRLAAPGDSSEWHDEDDDGDITYDCVIATKQLRFGAFDGSHHLRSLTVLTETPGDKGEGGTSVFTVELAINGRGGVATTKAPNAGSKANGDGGAATTYTTSFSINDGEDRSTGESEEGQTQRSVFAPLVSRMSSMAVWLNTADAANEPGVKFVGLSIEYTALEGTGWTTEAERN